MKRCRAILFLFLASITNLSAQSDAILELGKTTFQACSLCHGPDGKGAKAGDVVMAPSLPESPVVKAGDAEALVAVVLKGIAKEDNQYLQQMVPLEAALNDEQIAAVAAYVRHEFGGKSSEKITPAQIKRWRNKYKKQTIPWKRAELASIGTEPVLSNISYAVYKGEWNKLPDFSTMEPFLRGKLKKGTKLSLDVAKDLRDNFGVVFNGDLEIKKTDTYEFSLLSDDGSALVIDGEGIIDNDGIHPGVTKTAREKLEAGNHTFKILYFERGGGEEFAFSARTQTLGEINFSKTAVKKAGKKKSYPPIVINPPKNEAIVHRAFLPGEKPRAIGVGYPGGINLVWNADTLNLSALWRGDFMDTSPHWNARGCASKPLGEKAVKPAVGLPLQRLESLDEPWVPFSEAKIKYERDTPNPQKEITFNIKHQDYQFRGYRLDPKTRFPTFRYHYMDLEVTDTFTPGKDGDKDTVIRTITIDGAAAENLYLRVSDLSPAETDTGWYKIGEMSVKIEGAEPVTRLSGKTELLATVSGDSTLTITYRWDNPRTEI